MEIQEINNRQYLVNIDGLFLQDIENKKNIVHIDVMQDRGTHYDVLLLKDGEPAVTSIPQFVHMDPEGMRYRYSIPEDAPLPIKDADFACNKALLEARIQGKMRPIVQIKDWKYKVDGSTQLIRPCFTELQWPAFKFADFEKTGTGFRIYLDPSNGFILSKKEIPSGRDLLYADIPDLHILDPVGTAMNQEIAPEFYTQRFPVRELLVINSIGGYKKVAFNQTNSKKRATPVHKKGRKL